MATVVPTADAGVILIGSKTGRTSSDVARVIRRDGLLRELGCSFSLFTKEALHPVRDRWEEGKSDEVQ